jgi:hypothetical protein
VAAWRINGREKVTDSRREHERTKKSQIALPHGSWVFFLAGRRRVIAPGGVGGGLKADGPPPAFVARSPDKVRTGLGGAADFSYWRCYKSADGPIAQLDRVTDFYSVGCRFESCWDRQSFQ